jgi:hypothetical protein
MKYKLLFGFLFMASVAMANQVVFDPATYDPGDLPAGMEIVDIDGELYCQIVLDEWNSVIPVDDVIVDAGRTHFRMDAKYAIAGSDTLTLDDINTFLKLGNFRTSVEIGAAGAASSADFIQYMTSVEVEDTVTGVQLAGQETTDWGATTGDTLWIGKVELITYDAAAVMNPGQIDPDDLPAGMTIEMIDGTEYVRVITAGWGNLIPVEDRIVTAARTHFSADMKYAIAGTDTLTLDDINTFLKVGNYRTSVEIGAAGSASSADFTTYTVAIDVLDTITGVQITGQETTDWGATTGDTLWIGKVVLLDLQNPSAVENLAGSVEMSNVILTWDAATDNASVHHYNVYQDDALLDDVTDVTFTVESLADATYTFGVIAVDGSGNESAASEVEITVNVLALNNQVSEKLAVYPNPANAELNIDGIDNIESIEVYSVTGAMVMEVTETNKLDISSLNEGLYMIKVKAESEVYSTTFVKE